MTDIFLQILQVALLLGVVFLIVLLIYRRQAFLQPAQSASWKQDEKYRNLFEQAGDGIIVHDFDGNILDVNLSVCDLFGYSTDEFRQLSIEQLYPSGDERLKKSWAAFATSESDDGVKFESEFITSKGKPLIGEVSLKVIQDSQNKYLHAVFRDVTARKQAQIALETQNQKYLSLLENVNAISWELELSNSRFLYISPNVERILGYPEKDWVDMDSWLSMIVKEDREYAGSHCTAETAAGRDHIFEYRMRKSNGELIWVLDVVRVIKDESGHPIRLAGVIFDHTEQHELTRQLEDSQRVHEKAQEIAQLGNWQFDLKSEKIFWSDDIYQMLDFDVKQDLNKDFIRQIIHPDDWPNVKTSLKAIIDDGAPHEMEYRVSCGGNEQNELWFYCKAERLSDVNGEPEKLSGIVQDITERKHIELALRTSESFLNDVFDAIQGGISVLDTDFNIVKTNRWLDEYYKQDVPLAGKKCYRVYQQQDQVCSFCPSKEVLQSGEPQTEVVSTPLADGKIGWMELSVFPVKDDSGQVVNVIEYVKDITERRRAEQKLERFRNLLEQSSDAIFIIDAENAAFIDANRAACEGLGYELDELLGMYVWDIDENITHEAAWLDLIGRLEKGSLPLTESAHRKKGGMCFPVEINARLVDDEGGSYFISIARDLTDIVRIRKQLVESEQKMRAILDNVDACIYLKDQDGRYLFANQAVCDLWHVDMEAVIGYGDEKFFDQASSAAIQVNDRRVLIGGETLHTEEANTLPETGITRVYQSTKLPLRHDNDSIYALCGISVDITELKNTEKALKESERRFRIAGQAAYDLIYERDVSTDRLEWYGDVDRMLGYEHGWISEDIDSWLRLIHPDDLSLLQDSVELHRSCTEEIQIVYRIMHADGSYRYWNDHALPLLDSGSRPYRWVGVCTDITLQKEYQLQLEHNANHDMLTGLPNRTLLSDRLGQAMRQRIRYQQKLAVVYIDLDGFKQINDVYGHDVGDQVLIKMAGRFEKTLREGDTIARFGGDEFVAVLPDIGDKEACLPLLKRLLHAAVQPIRDGDRFLQVSASLGVSLYPQDEEVDGDQLLRQADQAMYQSKVAGKNRYSFFDTEYDRNLRGKKEGLQRIKQGLIDNEFELFYQPKVNMRSGDVIGVEALLRWRHPQQGLLPPSQFLPAIEDQVLSVQLGEWVLETALAQIADWEKQGIKTSVSVNIGAQQLQTVNFMERLKKIIQKYPQVEPARLQLEILETSALDDMNHVSTIMQECLEFGVEFALDDFGTGYSSLSYLKHLPATWIKIDRSFVRDMLIDPDDLAILEGILGMSTAFRRNVIAEGVETVEHGELLLKLGCECAQGYGIARPMPAQEFPEWVKNWCQYSSWQHQYRVSRDDLSLLFASIEHRAWVNSVEEAIVNKRSNFPVLNHTQCRFAHWLDDDGGKRYRHLATFQEINDLHEKIHDLANTLYRYTLQGQYEEANAGLVGLHQHKQRLLQLMDTLIKAPIVH